MNAAHAHLLINHLPMAALAFALIAMVIGLVFKNPSIKRFGLGTLAASGAIGAAAYLTGSAAEEEYFGEQSPFHSFVERHEESAEVTWLVGMVAGTIGLIALMVTRRLSDVPSVAMAASLLATLVSAAFFAVTANLGGYIQHSEIRSDALSKSLNRLESSREEDDES